MHSDLRQTLAALRLDPGQTAILCDIDGTLAPIVADPAAAAVPASTRDVLAGLADRYGLVACVSGRRALAAREMVGVAALTYAGNHGLELLAPGESEAVIDPAVSERAEAAARLAHNLDWGRLREAGLRLEDKGPIQAIHWRGAPDEEAALRLAHELGELAEREGLVTHHGRKVLELRPTASVHKGVAVRRLVAESGVRRAMFGGDDRTDLDAFAALRELAAERRLERAVCVGVRSVEGPPEIVGEADVVVAGTDEFASLLGEL